MDAQAGDTAGAGASAPGDGDPGADTDARGDDVTATAGGAEADAGTDAGDAGSAPRDEDRGGGAAATATDPQERLQALQDDIDAVRRRVEEDTVDQGDEAFIQEGEASEGEPVDDTIAPPG